MEKIEDIKNILEENEFRINRQAISEDTGNLMIVLEDNTILYFGDDKLNITFDIRILPEVASNNSIKMINILKDKVDKFIITESYYKTNGVLHYGEEAQDKYNEYLKGLYIVEYLREKQNDIYLKDEYFGYNC